MKRKRPPLLPSLLLTLLLHGPALAADVYAGPLLALATAGSNVIIGLDDSGSMDFEVLQASIDGALWWDDAAGAGWNAQGVLNFGNAGTGPTPVEFAYLFPDGCGPGLKSLCENMNIYAVAPTPQFAFLRSPDYNPLYYDSSLTYTPWKTAYVHGTQRSFGDAPPSAAPSDPLYPSAGQLDLGSPLLLKAPDTTFMMRPGMTIPAGAFIQTAYGSQAVTQPQPVPYGSNDSIAMSYYPATFWRQAACTVDGIQCVAAPDGKTLLRYEIRRGNTFPSGRSYDDEMQNFANWYTYYRKRRLMVGAAMGPVLASLGGMRMGVVSMNNRQPPVMYDIDSADPSHNAQAVLGVILQNAAQGGTPTRELLGFIGDQFHSNKALITAGCQHNVAFIITDGFADATPMMSPPYDSQAYGSGPPYQPVFPRTLADIALSYYTINLRPDLPSGKVSTAVATPTNPGADANPNPHMNTFAMTLRTLGTLWPAWGDPYARAVPWPNPVDSGSPTAVDDLWHATLNGRGSMYNVQNPVQAATAFQDAIARIKTLAGSQGGVAFNSVNIRAGDALGYLTSFQPASWTGDLVAYKVNPATGQLAGQALWSASARLQARDYHTRVIASHDGMQGVPFTADAMGSRLHATGLPGSSSALVAYLRGSRDDEATLWRPRAGMLGAIIHAEPVALADTRVVFAATNEGLLHAFDQDTGDELWAYAPGFALSGMAAQSQRGWTYTTLLDGSPALGQANGRTLLVGGAGTAGSGFYALDVTQARGTLASAQDRPTDASVAARVLWEFPDARTPAAVTAQVGLSMGKPLVARTRKYGDVVFLTSGYNAPGDGRGRLFVLKALTGELLATLSTGEGSHGASDAGLAQVSGFSESDGTVNTLYGGDNLGNLWRFDVQDGSVLKLARLVDGSARPQPVTSAPELALVQGRRMVFVGTGRLLGRTDLAASTPQSFYAIWDQGTTLAAPRTQLAPRTITISNALRKVSGPAVDWTHQSGWFIDLPPNERANTDPSIGMGVLSFTTNSPTQGACNNYSAIYLADVASGMTLPASAFPDGNAYFGAQLDSNLTGRVAMTRLPSGVLVITTHQSDNSTTSRQLSPAPPQGARITGWREILR